MKKLKLKLATLLLTLSCLAISVNAEETAIEWAPFIKAKGVSDKSLVLAADSVNSAFLSKQKGFIKRELIKKNDTEYADVIYWENKSYAIAAGEKVNSCIECNDYFQLMKMGEKAGEGFSHYTILKTWLH